MAGLALAIAFLAFTLTRGITGPCEGLTCPLPRVGPGPHGTDPYVSETHGYRLDAASARCPDDMQVRERGPAAIDWTVADDDGGGAWPVRVEAEPAVGRTAEQMVATYQRRQYPDASMAYVIPRAQLGFNPGYGAVYDLTFVGDAGVPIQSRLVVMSAVKDDLAITLAGVGPLDTRVRAHPNPARTSTVICFSDVGNTITWPGDDPL